MPLVISVLLYIYVMLQLRDSLIACTLLPDRATFVLTQGHESGIELLEPASTFFAM